MLALTPGKVGNICNSALKIELCVHFKAAYKGIFGLCKQHDQPELEMKTLVAWQEYREMIWAAKDCIRETKTLTELNLAMVIKCIKKSFYRYISDEEKIRGNVRPLQE